LQEYEQIEVSFQAKHGIFMENDGASASLADREQSSEKGHIIISRLEQCVETQ